MLILTATSSRNHICIMMQVSGCLRHRVLERLCKTMNPAVELAMILTLLGLCGISEQVIYDPMRVLKTQCGNQWRSKLDRWLRGIVGWMWVKIKCRWCLNKFSEVLIVSKLMQFDNTKFQIIMTIKSCSESCIGRFNPHVVFLKAMVGCQIELTCRMGMPSQQQQQQKKKRKEGKLIPNWNVHKKVARKMLQSNNCLYQP